MRTRTVVFALFITLTILSGCGPTIVRVRPPEPLLEVYGTPPYAEAVWIAGHWKQSRGEWVWVPGYWARPPRPQAVWIPGYWDPKEGGWVWVPGRWEYR
ncbi:MAG: YXWGXW repeat-containing protein [Syntrophaceae bacterium]|nr:YXWGXW repeat-containing protein [Syntrophaceae bacterium]